MAVSKPGMMAVPRGMTPPEPKNIETKFREVSQLYEKQFMREMVKAMRATVPESGLIKNETKPKKIFRETIGRTVRRQMERPRRSWLRRPHFLTS